MDPTAVSAIIISIISALGLLIERTLSRMKRLKSSCCGMSVDLKTKSTSSRASIDSPSTSKQEDETQTPKDPQGPHYF